MIAKDLVQFLVNLISAIWRTGSLLKKKSFTWVIEKFSLHYKGNVL